MPIAFDGIRYWQILRDGRHVPSAVVISSATADALAKRFGPAIPWPQAVQMVAASEERVVSVDTRHAGNDRIVTLYGALGREVVVVERYLAIGEGLDWFLGEDWALARDAAGEPVAIVMGMREENS